MHLFLNSKNPISCLPPSVIKGFASTFTSCLCSAPPHLHSPMFRFDFFFLSLCLSDASGGFAANIWLSRSHCIPTAVCLHGFSSTSSTVLCVEPISLFPDAQSIAQTASPPLFLQLSWRHRRVWCLVRFRMLSALWNLRNPLDVRWFWSASDADASAPADILQQSHPSPSC